MYFLPERDYLDYVKTLYLKGQNLSERPQGYVQEVWDYEKILRKQYLTLMGIRLLKISQEMEK